MKTCFFTCYDNMFTDIGEGLVRSVKKFYPDIPFIVFDVPREKDSAFDLRKFCDFHLRKGRELLEEYDRIISVDTDHIMCNMCPDLFGDYELGVVQNNIPVNDSHGGMTGLYYVNAGLTVCTNKDVWEEWMTTYQNLCNIRWETLNEQNALNTVAHTTKHTVDLLEFKDRVYGISEMFSYEDMYVENDELYVNSKKICMFHAAGIEWKEKDITNKQAHYNFELIKDEKAREKLKSFIQ